MTSISPAGTVPSRLSAGPDEAPGASCSRAPHDLAGAAEGKVCLVERSNGGGGVSLEPQARFSALVRLQSCLEQASHPAAGIFQQTFRANLCYFPSGTEKRFRIRNLAGTLLFIPLAPLLGGAIGLGIILYIHRLFWHWIPAKVDRLFRRGQLLSTTLYSINHGGNDAQETMRIIVALLVAAGAMSPTTQLSLTDLSTLWIIYSCHAAMGLGTALGGWRIVKTLGMRITMLRPVGGFSAETAGAVTLFMVTHFGIPVSTTHSITGAVIGVGSVQRFSAVSWGIAMRIVWAWILTNPAAALMVAACFHAIARAIGL